MTGWITESYPTNRHTFSKRRVLLPTESLDDFKEVTDAQKTALEKADEEAVVPDDKFVDDWLAAGKSTTFVGVRGRQYTAYNPERNQFYLYDDPITYEQAKRAMELKTITDRETLWNLLSLDYTTEKLLPLKANNHDGIKTSAFSYSKFDVLAFDSPHYSSQRSSAQVFYSCDALRKILNYNNRYESVNEKIFYGCSALETLEFIGLNCSSLHLEWSPKLSEYSVRFLIQYVYETIKTKTVTLHPDAYARLSEETFALAESKNIVLATT